MPVHDAVVDGRRGGGGGGRDKGVVVVAVLLGPRRGEHRHLLLEQVVPVEKMHTHIIKI